MTQPLLELLTSYRRNRTLHGHSVYRKASVRGHNIVHRWDASDALDLFCPAGTSVRVIHSGNVRDIRQRNGRLAAVILYGVNGTYSVYAHLHIKDDLQEGDYVAEGAVIGWVGRKLSDPHLHLELAPNGVPLAARTPYELAAKMVAVINR